MSRTYGLLLLLVAFSHGAAQPAPSEPKTAIEWFQRANDQMNIRMPGSAPFHMKVTFQALPGQELLDIGEKPRIITGDGVYEEIWLEPHRWRREVTLGSYHATEVEGNHGRKMQASSDYEPSRVLMLVKLLQFVTSQMASREFQHEHGPAWKIDHVKVGDLALVRLSQSTGLPGVDFANSEYFLPSGRLMLKIGPATTTILGNYKAFADKFVPTHISVSASQRELLKAEVEIEPQGELDPSLLDLPVQPADAGNTLRSISANEVKVPDLDNAYFGGVNPGSDMTKLGLVISSVLDKEGRYREAELLLALREENTEAARSILLSMRKAHHSPAVIDGSPCEVAVFPVFEWAH